MQQTQERIEAIESILHVAFFLVELMNISKYLGIDYPGVCRSFFQERVSHVFGELFTCCPFLCAHKENTRVNMFLMPLWFMLSYNRIFNKIE